MNNKLDFIKTTLWEYRIPLLISLILSTACIVLKDGFDTIGGFIFLLTIASAGIWTTILYILTQLDKIK